MEDQRRHTVETSRNGCLIAWSESRGTHGIALAGEDWYDVRYWQLIVTPDGTAKEDKTWRLIHITAKKEQLTICK